MDITKRVDMALEHGSNQIKACDLPEDFKEELLQDFEVGKNLIKAEILRKDFEGIALEKALLAISETVHDLIIEELIVVDRIMNCDIENAISIEDVFKNM